MKLNCYASGDGSLSFVWSLNNQAQDDQVTTEHILDYVRANLRYAGWLIIEGLHPKMVKPVRRLSSINLVMDNSIYRYDAMNDRPSWQKFNFFESNTGERVVNYSMRSALGYFLLNEESFENAIKISDVI